LFWRTAAAILALLALAVTVPAVLRLAMDVPQARRDLSERTVATAIVAAEAAAGLISNKTPTALERLVTTLAAHDADVDVVLVTDRSGKVLAHSERGREGLVLPELAFPPLLTQTAEIERPGGGSALKVTTPVLRGGKPWGTVQVEAGLERLDAMASDEITHVVYLSVAFI